MRLTRVDMPRAPKRTLFDKIIYILFFGVLIFAFVAIIHPKKTIPFYGYFTWLAFYTMMAYGALSFIKQLLPEGIRKYRWQRECKALSLKAEKYITTREFRVKRIYLDEPYDWKGPQVFSGQEIKSLPKCWVVFDLLIGPRDSKSEVISVRSHNVRTGDIQTDWLVRFVKAPFNDNGVLIEQRTVAVLSGPWQ